MVTVYSLQKCVQCTATYRKLDALGVPYAVVFLEVDTRLADELREKGFTQAPIIERPDGTLFSGFQPDLLTELANALPKPE